MCIFSIIILYRKNFFLSNFVHVCQLQSVSFFCPTLCHFCINILIFLSLNVFLFSVSPSDFSIVFFYILLYSLFLYLMVSPVTRYFSISQSYCVFIICHTILSFISLSHTVSFVSHCLPFSAFMSHCDFFKCLSRSLFMFYVYYWKIFLILFLGMNILWRFFLLLYSKKPCIL